MNLCSRHAGDEVCFEGKDCPACEIEETLNERIKELESELEDARTEIKHLSGEL